MKNKKNKATQATKEYEVCYVVTYTATIKANSQDEADEMASHMVLDLGDMEIQDESIEVTEL